MRRWILVLGLLALPAWGGEGLALVGMDGSPVSLLPAPEQGLLLHFWATWCPTCLDDLHDLERAAATCSQTQVRVLTVNVGEDQEEISEFVRRHDIHLLVLRDPKGRVWRELNGRGLPMNLFWTQKERRMDVGPKSKEAWLGELGALGCWPSNPDEGPDADRNEPRSGDPGQDSRVEILRDERPRENSEQRGEHER